MAVAQRGVIFADFLLTLTGITLLIIGGVGATYAQGLKWLREGWLVWGQVLFAISGIFWLAVLVPLQIRQKS